MKLTRHFNFNIWTIEFFINFLSSQKSILSSRNYFLHRRWDDVNFLKHLSSMLSSIFKKLINIYKSISYMFITYFMYDGTIEYTYIRK